MTQRFQKQRGAVTLIGALFILITLALMIQVLHRMAGSDILDTAVQNDSMEALFVAETGIEHISYLYANGTGCAGLSGVSDSAGRGNFTVTSAVLVVSDCRIQVQGTVGSTVTAQANRTVSADLRFTAPSTAWAVGKNGDLFSWDGSNWSVVSGPSTNPNLKSVHCVTSTECWAVGKDGFVWHYTGGTWTETVLDSNEDYEDIDCAPNNPSFCFLVGKDGGGIIRFWDGSSWSASTTTADDLKAVSCPSTTCYAVGKDNQPPLRFDGSNWVEESSDVGDELKGLHCYTTDACWAVGKRDGEDYRFAFRSGSGSPIWQETLVASAYKKPDLESVYCVSANDCWAVGKDVDTLGGGPKKQYNVVHWDGSSWTAQSLGDGEDLKEVACSSASNCLAVGKKGAILRWNGVSWSDASSAIVGNANLESVAFSGSGSGGSSVQVVRWTEIIAN